MLDLVYLILGAGILALGGELLIKGSMSAAVRLRISPLLVGLIIVGFGTSAPEFVVSFQAAIAQKPDIAVGNVIGSNVGNILLILGICTLISPLTVKP
ncbi:MAG: sodium:calcium antiporter, partial [Gammaproteobacteria bacterium]|nr:sodium:calcium antiporter [Gammaproteobacteria bacterium]